MHNVNSFIGIPTALTPDELATLCLLGAGRRVYEAGALLGASTIALAQAARFVVSVDPHEGYPRLDPAPTWAAFLANLRRAGVANVQPVRAAFEDAPPVGAYDVAFADLTGERAITARFLESVRHVPTVAIHDYGRAGCQGATDAVDGFIRTSTRRVWRADTLIVMETT